MQKLKQKKTIIIIVACLLLVIAAVYQQISNKQDTLSLLQQVEAKTAQYKELKGDYPTFELLDENGEFLNYAVISSSSGYGGPITTLTAINKKGSIVHVIILNHAETPSYMNRVLNEGYPQNLKGASITKRLAGQEGIDAISGATKTSEGIIGSVEKGMAQVGENQLAVKVPQLESFHFQWQDGAVVTLLIFMVLAAMRKIKKLRPWLLAASVIVIGFMAQTALTVGNFTSILANKMPTLGERPIWYILVIGIFIITLISGKNLYCGWLCPFGAVQEGIYKALHLTNVRLNQRMVSIARKGRWFFIWLAVMLALFFHNPGIASYEPFSVFFGGEGNTAQWIIMGLVLVMSIVVLRFWCRCFCPVGAVLDAVAQAKRRVKKLLVGKTALQERPLVQGITSCKTCSTCQSGCGKKDMKDSSISPFNKLIAGLIIIIDLLIIGALLQNVWLLS